MIREITERNFPEYATLHKATISFEEMGERIITTQVKIDGDIAPDFSVGADGETGWELEYKGETFVLNTHTPQATKNDTTRCSLVDLTFESAAMAQLKRYYFVEMAEIETGTYIIDKYVASLRLNARDFLNAFNRVLNYYFGGDITVTSQADLSQYTEAKEVELNYTYIWNALAAFYDQYGLIWRIEKRSGTSGYNIVLGDTAQTISHTFQYGYDGGLKSIQRQLEDAEIYNQLFGRGGEKNLPYRYFKRVDENNPIWAGDPDAIYELRNVYFGRLLDINFRWYVRGWMQNSHRDHTWENDPDDPYTYPTYTLSQSSPYYYAFHRGQTDESFNPVEFIQDDNSIAEYGVWQGKLDDNDDIYPTIQGAAGGIDQIVAVGPIVDSHDDQPQPESVLTESVEATVINLNTVGVSGGYELAMRKNGTGSYNTIRPEYGSHYKVTFYTANYSVPEGYLGQLTMPWTVVPGGGTVNAIAVTNVDVVARRVSAASPRVPARVGEDESATFPISALPGGKTYRFEVTVEFEALIDNPVQCDISIGAGTLTSTLDIAQDETRTFDIWVKNIFDTTRGASESALEYAERVWGPILGDRTGGEAKVVFSTGALSVSSDYEFTIVAYPTFDRTKTNSEWRIRLARSEAEYQATGKLIPNEQSAPPVAGDHFFFIGIDMPNAYVTMAEERLNESKQEALSSRAYANPTWVVELDKNRIQTKLGAETATLFNELNVGKVMQIYDARFTGGQTLGLGIRSMTITWDDNTVMYPNVQVVLSENVMSVTPGYSDTITALYARVNATETQIMQQLRTKSYATASGEYLSSTKKDEAGDRINFRNGIGFGKNGENGHIDGEGNADLRTLRLREFLEVPEIRYNRVDVQVGNVWRAPGGGIIDHVDIDAGRNSGTIYLHLEDGEIGHVAVGDICMGIFHDGINENSNAIADADDSKGNFHFAGFYTTYFWVNEILAQDNSVFRYTLRDTDARWTETFHPCAAMHFVGYGSFSDVSRQTSRYSTLTYERYLKDVDDWEFDADNIAAQFGDLSNLATIDQERFGDMTGYSAYLENIYMTGYFRQTTNPPAKRIDIDTENTTVLAAGESLTMTCVAMEGWDTLTVSNWKIERHTSDAAADATWNNVEGHRSFGGTISISYNDLSANDSSTLFTITATLSDNTTVTSNVLLTKVRSGQDGRDGRDGDSSVALVLDHYSDNMAYNSAGDTRISDAVVVNAMLLKGGVELPFPINWTPSSVTGSSLGVRNGKFTVDGIATDASSGTVTASAIYNNINAAIVFLYIRSNPPAIPKDTYYNFLDGNLYIKDNAGNYSLPSATDLNGWQTTIPEGTGSIYVRAAAAISNGGFAEIGKDSWAYRLGRRTDVSTPTSTMVMLYKRASSANGTVDTVGITDTLYYKYATPDHIYSDDGYSVDADTELEGWSITVPGGAGPLYVTAAVTLTSDSSKKDSIAGDEWVKPVKVTNQTVFSAVASFTKVKDGSQGPAGYNKATVYLYKRSANGAPSTANLPNPLYYRFSEPKNLYTDAEATTPATDLDGWSIDIPDGSDPIYVTAAIISSNTDIDDIDRGEWVEPVQLGSRGINSAPVFLYQRTETPPQTPSFDPALWYCFADGKLYTKSGSTYTAVTPEILGDWKTQIPDGDLPCYVSQAAALNADDYDQVTEWSAPNRLVKDGEQGPAGENGEDGTDGEDAIMLVLDNSIDAITYGANGTKKSGDVLVNAKMMKGGKELLGVPFTWTLSGVTATSSGIRNDHLTVTGFEADENSGTATASAVYNNINAAPVFLYKRDSSGLTPQRDFSTTLYYKFSDGKLYVDEGITLARASDMGGWDMTIPDGNAQLYVMNATILGTSDLVAVPASLWIGRRKVTGNPNPDDGKVGALVMLYKRSAEALGASDKPVNTLYYQYNTPNTIYYYDSNEKKYFDAETVQKTNGWSMTVPENSSDPLYVIAAVATAPSIVRDSISTGEWATPMRVPKQTIFTAVASITKVTDGQDGTSGYNSATLYLYKRSNGTVTRDWTGSQTYTFATDVLSPIPSGWSRNIPSTTSADAKLWVTAISVRSQGASVTISGPNYWAAPVVLAENGQPGATGAPGAPGATGAHGYNTATVYLYQRAPESSPPAVPSGNITYRFSTGKIISGSLGKWTTNIPSGPGNPCWVILATALGTEDTDIIQGGTDGEWIGPNILVQDGGQGPAGYNTATVYLYKRATDTPSVNAIRNPLYYRFHDTSGTYLYTDKTASSTPATATHLDGWSVTIPTTNPELPIWVTAAIASSTTDVDSIGAEWVAPAKMAQNGAKGDDGYSSAPVFLYQRAAEAPAKPTASLTYTFATGQLTGGDLKGWQQTYPASDGNPCWSIQAAASSITSTDIIAPNDWSDPQEIFEDGQDLITLVLDHSYDTIAYDPDGTKTGDDVVVEAKLYKGGNEIPAIPFSWTPSTGVSGSSSGVRNDRYTVSGLSAASGTVTASVRYNNIKAATVFIYERGDKSKTAPASRTFYYKFSDGKLYKKSGNTYTLATSSDLDNWQQSIPGGSGTLYYRHAPAIGTGEYAMIRTWSAIGSGGQGGALVMLYKRSASAPAEFNMDKSLRYQFATPDKIYLTTSGYPEADPEDDMKNWDITVPEPDGNPLYVTAAVVTSGSTYDTIGSGEWAVPIRVRNSTTYSAVFAVKKVVKENGITYRRSTWEVGKLYRNDVNSPKSGLRPTDGLTVIDIVYNKDIAIIGDSDLHIYQCRQTHESTDDNKPDTHHGTNDPWAEVNMLEPVATPLLLADTIAARYIDVDSLDVKKLTVKNSQNNIIAKMGDMTTYNSKVYPFWIGGSTPTDNATKFRIDSAGNITAKGGTIGGFNIENNFLGAADNTDGMSLHTNYITFRETTTGNSAGTFRATIGTNVLSSASSRTLAYFSAAATGSSLSSSDGCGIRCNITGYGNNYAFYCDNGLFAGLRPNTKYVNGTGSYVLKDTDFTVVADNSGAYTLNLPSSPQRGQTYLIYHLTPNQLTFNYNGGKRILKIGETSPEDTKRSTVRELIIIAFDNTYGYWVLRYI